jgi:hypothetical protein
LLAGFRILIYNMDIMATITRLAGHIEAPTFEPLIVPHFVQDIGRLAAATSYGEATSEVFAESGISVTLTGNVDTAAGGLIIAADHRHRIEPLVEQAAMYDAGRPHARVIASPGSFAGRMMQTSGPYGHDLILPVVPAVPKPFSSEGPGRTAHNVLNRLRFPGLAAMPDDLRREINIRSLAKASSVAAAGEAVTIFPHGKTREAADQEWYPGVGKIVQGVPEADRDATYVAVQRPEDFSTRGVLAALAGVSNRRHSIDVRTQVVGTVREVLDEASASDVPVAQAVSQLLKTKYLQTFER